jgi:hypothetical protein
MSQLMVILPDALSAELERASSESNRKPDDLAAELLRGALAARRIRQAREKALHELGDSAPTTDEDAFKLMQ